MLKNLISTLLTIISVVTISFGQSHPQLAFFRLPVLDDSLYVTGNAYVSCNFYVFNQLLKNYNGRDKEISKLSQLIKYVSLNQQSNYNNISDNTDTTIENSYKFYNYFVSHSKNPKLIYKIEIGSYKIFFVALEPGFPLMTFCFLQKNNSLLNHPSTLNHPAIVGVTVAVNKSYAYPAEFKLMKAIPSTNTKIIFDSTFGFQKALIFYFDLIKLNFNCNNKIRYSDTLALSLDPCLNFYCQTIEYIKQDYFEKYFSSFSKTSSVDIKKSLKDASPEGMEFYKNYISADSLVTRVINFGAIELLIVTNREGENPKSFRSVYLKANNKQQVIKWINVNHLFYFDELLKTSEFMKALF